MSKIFIALATLFALAISTPAQSQGKDTPLSELGDLIVGRWMSEVTWAVDYPGRGKKGEKVTGVEICSWVVDKTAIKCEGYAGETTWIGLYWWDAESKSLKSVGLDSGGNWAEGTIAKSGPKLEGSASGNFADGQRVKYEWETTFTNGGNTRIEKGATILNGVRNEFRDVFERVGK